MPLTVRQIKQITAEAQSRGCAQTVTEQQEEHNQASTIKNLTAQLRSRGIATPALDALDLTNEQITTRAAATRAAAHAAGTAQTPEQRETMKRAHGYGQ